MHKRNIKAGDYIRVYLIDGTILEGKVIKIGKRSFVINGGRTFWDYMFIEFQNVVEIQKRSF